LDQPTGIRLDEYIIDKGKFIPTSHLVALGFVEAESVWNFRIQSIK
jgi:hypothetical protein